MNMRAALMMSCGLLVAAPAFASVHDILIGLDEKVAYGPDGQANAPPGNDAVIDGEYLQIRPSPAYSGYLPLMNSLLGVHQPICRLRRMESWGWSRTRW